MQKSLIGLALTGILRGCGCRQNQSCDDRKQAHDIILFSSDDATIARPQMHAP